MKDFLIEEFEKDAKRWLEKRRQDRLTTTGENENSPPSLAAPLTIVERRWVP